MIWAGLLLTVAPALLTATPVEAPRPIPRDPIGTVLGEPIFRDQLRQEFPVRDELYRLVGPALQKYRDEHREQIEPTDAEVTFAAEAFRCDDPEKWSQRDAEWKAELAGIEQVTADSEFQKLPPDERQAIERRKAFLTESDPARSFAKFVLDSRKFNRHLYETFDGGRLLWQQAGVEAFDASRRWLETLEARGDFSINDPELRTTFYEYWTNDRLHGSFLFTREKNPQVFDEFLNPPWFPAEPPR